MKIGRLLEKLGLWSDGVDDKAPAAAPAEPEKKFEKRTVSLDSLRAARAEAARDLESGQSAARLALDVSVEQIYTAAKVPVPEHGWTLDRLARELKPEDNVALVLAEHKIPPETLLEDGIARDQALDRFEEHLETKVQGYLEASQARMADLEEKARELQGKIAELQSEQDAVRARLEAFRARKHAAEDELERAAALIASLVQKTAPKFSGRSDGEI